MTQSTIDIEGLPEGWEIEFVNVSGINFDTGRTSIKAPVVAHMRKIQPRRIVLEETEEIRKAKPDEYYEHTGGLAINKSHRETSGEYKIWREVKE